MAAQKNRLYLIILTSILFAIYSFVFGDSGLIVRARLGNDSDILTERIVNLKKENLGLQDRLRRYRTGELLKEESVKSGYINRGEKLLFFRGNRLKDTALGREMADKKSGYSIKLLHLRILWIVLSAIIVLFYYIRQRNYYEE